MSTFRKIYTTFWKDGKVIEELTPEDINDKVNHWLEINKEEINELKNKKGNIYMFK